MNPKSSDPRPPVIGNEGHATCHYPTASVAPVNTAFWYPQFAAWDERGRTSSVAACVADLDTFCRELDLLLPGIQLALASMANRLIEAPDVNQIIRVKRDCETIAGLLTSCVLKAERGLGRLAPYLEASGSDREAPQ